MTGRDRQSAVKYGAWSAVEARVTGVASLATLLGVLPSYLLGPLAVFVAVDITLDPVRLGTLVSVFFASSALFSVPAGMLTARLDSRLVLSIAGAGSAVSLLGIAVLPPSFAGLCSLLVVGGFANSLSQPSSNVALQEYVHQARHGLAFGIKQSAAALGTLLAGVSVPAIGQTLGWRWAYGLCAALVVPCLAIGRGRRSQPRQLAATAPVRPARQRSDLAQLTVAVFFATLALAGGATFFVPTMVLWGWDAATAGVLLAVGAVISIAGRALSGWLSDVRRYSYVRTTTIQLAIGAVGATAIVTLPAHPAAVVVGAACFFGIGWSWPGLVHFATVREFSTNPARSTAVMMSGIFAGNLVGPLLFGVVTSSWSHTWAWALVATETALATGLFALLNLRRQPSQVPTRPVG